MIENKPWKQPLAEYGYLPENLVCWTIVSAYVSFFHTLESIESQWRTGHINQLATHRGCGLQALAQQRAETLRLGPQPSASSHVIRVKPDGFRVQNTAPKGAQLCREAWNVQRNGSGVGSWWHVTGPHNPLVGESWSLRSFGEVQGWI